MPHSMTVIAGPSRSMRARQSGCGGRMDGESGGESVRMSSETLIIVVGGDDLAFEVCRELLLTHGHAVCLLWKSERGAHHFSHVVAELTRRYPESFRSCDRDPRQDGALEEAGLRRKDDA